MKLVRESVSGSREVQLFRTSSITSKRISRLLAALFFFYFFIFFDLFKFFAQIVDGKALSTYRSEIVLTHIKRFASMVAIILIILS